MRKCWSKDEINFLKKLYETDGLGLSEFYDEFSKKYGNRTLIGVGVKIAKLKLRHTKEQLRQIKSRLNTGSGNGMFGKTSTMKGLTTENSEMMRIKGTRISATRKRLFQEGKLPSIAGEKNPMYGKESWCKGKTKYTDPRLMALGIKGSATQKRKWLEMSQEKRDIVLERLNRNMISQHGSTFIEDRVEEILSSFGLAIHKDYHINKFYVDFYLPDYNLAIECDGDYWHANPRKYGGRKLTNVQKSNVDRDERKNKMLLENGIGLLRIWEYDIRRNIDEVKQTIWERLQMK